MQYDPPPSPSAPTPSTSPASPADRRRLWLRRLLPLGAAVVLGVLVGVAVAAAIHMPRVDALADYRPGLITELRDRAGAVFATFARQRRVMLQEVPPLLQNAVMAAEDSNFLRHGGVDAQGILRAALSNLRSGRKSEGASTITMQLARKLFLTPDKRWARKIEEAFVAVEIEKRYSKPQILALYCNVEFLGHGNYGMASAARYYFDKDVRDLKPAEAAMLAGILQRPSDYSPYRNPQAVLKRRNHVLKRMLDERYLTPAQYDEALASPLGVVEQRPHQEVGDFFAEEVRQHLENTQGAAALYDQGLEVRTTLDPAIQRATEKAVRDNLLRLDHRRGYRGPNTRLFVSDLESQTLPSWADWSGEPDSWVEGIVLDTKGDGAHVKLPGAIVELGAKGVDWTGHRRPAEVLQRGDVAWFQHVTPEKGEAYWQLEQEPLLESAALVLESATGAIRAMVGGWSFERSKFNRALQAKRQVGSGFKPFVYGAALEDGFTPADTLFDAPAVFPGADAQLSYSPRNYYRQYYGILTLRRALENSINVTTIKLLDLVGVQHVIDFARRCGVTEPLPPYPSLGLGSADLTPIEMAAAYATFANQGVYIEPYLIDSVMTHDGRLLESHAPHAHKAMEPAVAYVLSHMLEGVIDRGTGAAVADLPLDLAGKTGTTDDYSDAWFIGFTPRYTILTWVGYDRKRSIGRNMTGAEAALPAWRAIVEQGLKDGWLTKDERFTPPPGVVFENVEYMTGLLAVPGTPNPIAEAFLAGTQPTRPWEARWASIVGLPWYQQRPFYTPRAGERMPEQITNWDLVKQSWEEKAKEREQAHAGPR